MPRYSGRSRRGYGGYKSRGFKDRRVSEAQVARVVNKILKPEEKWVSYNQDLASILTGFQNIDDTVGDFDIIQGDGNNERIGRKVKVTKVFWRWSLRNDVALTSVASETVRLMIILDKQSQGADASASLVFEESTNWATFNSLLDQGRFKTLYDSGPIDLNKTGGSGDGTTNTYGIMSVSREVFKKNLSIELTFDASAGVIADMTTNHLMFWAGARAGGQVQIKSEVRVRYTDV